MTCKEVVGGHIDGDVAKVCGIRLEENRLRTQNGTLTCMWKIKHYLARPLISISKLCSIQNRYSISKYPDDTTTRNFPSPQSTRTSPLASPTHPPADLL